ncbi:MAG: hypothetical protein JKY37_29905 [Nannocystaceae bacterium]|nr:hypothetical protein [Nannocystaceae bacterium]
MRTGMFAMGLPMLACTDPIAASLKRFEIEAESVEAKVALVRVPWDPPISPPQLRVSARDGWIEIDNYRVVAAALDAATADPQGRMALAGQAAAHGFLPPQPHDVRFIEALALRLDDFVETETRHGRAPSDRVDIQFAGDLDETLTRSILYTLASTQHAQVSVLVQGPTRSGAIAALPSPSFACRATEASERCARSKVYLRNDGITIQARDGLTGPCHYAMKGPGDNALELETEFDAAGLGLISPGSAQPRTFEESALQRRVDAAKGRAAKDPTRWQHRAIAGQDGVCPTAPLNVAPQQLAATIRSTHALAPGCPYGFIEIGPGVPWSTFVLSLSALTLGAGVNAACQFTITDDGPAEACAAPLPRALLPEPRR